MSSILTNNSAMVALQTLKSVNMNLAKTQNEISTGKSVANARDNAAVWSISKQMDSDVKSFEAISETLNLGQATVATARNASETVTDLLVDMKARIVAAQEENVDRNAIQADITALTDQIKSVVSAAQFNGLNLVDGSQTDFNDGGNLGINILSSLDRDSSGGVATSNIAIDAQNLSTTAGATLTGAAASDVATLAANGGSDTATISVSAIQGGGTALDDSAPTADPATTNDGFIEGDTVRVTIGNITGSYTVQAGDNENAISTGIRDGLRTAGLNENDFTLAFSGADLTIQNQTNEANIAVSVETTRGTGALAQLDSIDVTSSAGAETALGNIEGMIQSSIEASASFGSAQGRIETQNTFVSQLTDSLKSGIGSLVDADMEEASAKLQALQVQQQLSVQALSIANQAPQSLLSLFR